MASTAQPRTALAATVAFVAGATYLLWRRSRFNSDEDEEEWEPVDRDHVVKFFQTINQLSHQNMMSFNQQIAQYRGKVPEQQLTDLAVGHFEDQLAKSQAQVLHGMRIPAEDMEDSSKYYQAERDSQVTKEMKMLKHLYMAVSQMPSDEEAPDLPDDLTPEKMVTVVTTFFKVSNRILEAVVQEYLARGENLAHPDTALKLSAGIQTKSGPAIDEAMKRFGLDSVTILPAMEKHQDNPEIRNAIVVGTEEQQAVLAAYGLA